MTLAADIRSDIKGLYDLLNNLDEELVKNGGRIYLIEDFRQSSITVYESYKKISDIIVDSGLLK